MEFLLKRTLVDGYKMLASKKCIQCILLTPEQLELQLLQLELELQKYY
jgi:hypothetical protein